MNTIDPFDINDQIHRCEHCGHTDQGPNRTADTTAPTTHATNTGCTTGCANLGGEP